MYTLLYFLLIIVSYSYIQSSTLVEAKLPIDDIAIDLIHRYSPNSPFYNSSMTRLERYQRLARLSSSRYHHLKWLKTVSNNNHDTSLIPNNGDYLIKISIGVPKVDLFVTVDTGSDLIWVQCKPCIDCYPQKSPIFNPNQSSTFHTLPCDSPFCRNSPQTNCSSQECEYWYAYGDGSSWTVGIMVSDILTISSENNSSLYVNSSIVFGCGFAQEGDFDENLDGIAGLGAGPLSLISQLGSSIAKTFSYCLTPSTSNLTSSLRFGSQAVATKQGVVLVHLLSQYIPTFYSINLTAITIGQKRVTVEKAIIIDSGSTLTYLDPVVYSNFEDAVKEAMGVSPMPKPQADFSLCYDKKSGFRAPEYIVFHLSEGDILLNKINYLIDLGEFVCLAIVPSSDEDDDFMILGNVAQVNFEVEFDLDSESVSFAPMNCALRASIA